MSLVSLDFIIFTIVLLLLYYTVGRKFQWILLLLASFVFYVSGDWHSLVYLGTTICVQYVCARFLDHENVTFEKEVKEKRLKGKDKSACKAYYTKRKKKCLLVSVIITVGILCYMKYANFMIQNINSILSKISSGMEIPTLEILIPLGISFYTFQSLGYIIDVYKGKTRAEKNIFKLTLFVSFFPTITQGPILRFEDVKDELYKQHCFNYKALVFGLERMLFGYLKKLVIAERLAIIGTSIIDNYVACNYPGIIIFAGVFLLGLRVYMDFSGGVDIIIGMTEALGIRLPENFERPYMARTYSEFWKRWHISLGAWFQRYVFFPISLSKSFNKLGKKGKVLLGEQKGKALAPSIASFIVFFIIGIWHGADWRYVAYGLWQAFFVAQKSLMESTYEGMRVKLHVNPDSKSYILFQIIRTAALVTIGRYFISANSLTDAFIMLKNTFFNLNFHVLHQGYFSSFGISLQDFAIITIFVLFVFIIDILNERGISLREVLYDKNLVVRWSVLYTGLFIVLLLGMYGPGYDTSTFVYQRF